MVEVIYTGTQVVCLLNDLIETELTSRLYDLDRDRGWKSLVILLFYYIWGQYFETL